MASVKTNPFIHIAVICLLGIIVYSNTFHSPFQWDDYLLIKNNPVIRDFRYFLSPSKAEGLGLHYYNLRDRYVAFLSFALNYRIHGLDVAGYHAVNLTLHLANAAFVYLLLLYTFKTPALKSSLTEEKAKYAALFASLLFVSHPVQTEAVTYLIRFPVLVSFFYLASLVLYVKWRGSQTPFSNRRPALYLLSLLSAVLAMKTKENAFTLPFVIALYEMLFFSSRNIKNHIKNRILSLFPFVLTLLIIPVTRLTAGVEGFIGDIYSLTKHHTPISRYDYFLTQMRVLVTYFKLYLFPVNQNFDYGYPVFHSILNPQVLLSMLLHLSLISFGVFLLLRSRKTPALRAASFGIFFFYTAISMESSIFPIPMIICEYRAYLPGAGAFSALSVGICLLSDKIRHPGFKKTLPAIGVLIIVVLSGATFARNALWKDAVTLWEDTVRKSPRNPRAHAQLAFSYKNKGQFDLAVKHYMRALELNPSYAGYNTSDLYMATGQGEQAAAVRQSGSKGPDGFDRSQYHKFNNPLGLSPYYEQKALKNAP